MQAWARGPAGSAGEGWGWAAGPSPTRAEGGARARLRARGSQWGEREAGVHAGGRGERERASLECVLAVRPSAVGVVSLCHSGVRGSVRVPVAELVRAPRSVGVGGLV